MEEKEAEEEEEERHTALTFQQFQPPGLSVPVTCFVDGTLI